MSTRSSKRFSLTILLLFLSFVSFKIHLTTGEDTLTLGKSLSGNQTIISKEGQFELGFFTPGNSHNYYIGIWYKQIPNKTVVWVANRENPVTNSSSSELTISEDGSLVLLNHSKIPIWSSNSTSSTSNSTHAVLLDTGNLILKDSSNSSEVIWQSFDHPTDTWLPGGWLGLNKITRKNQYISSWRNQEDPAPGPYSYSLDESGASEYFLLWNRSKSYWRTGIWTGHYFSLLPEMRAYPSFNFNFIENKQESYGIYPFTAVLGRSTMDLSGQFKTWMYVANNQEWQVIWTAPVSKCEVYSLCGAFGVCDEKNSLSCSCLYGFEPASVRDWDLSDRSAGCVRRINLQCGNETTNGTEDGFLMMPNMRLPVNPVSLTVRNAKECELACLNNCSCTAYAYASGCSIWHGDLVNLQQISDGDSGATTIYLRLAASELPTSSGKKKVVAEVLIGSVVGVVTSVCILLWLTWRYHRKRTSGTVKAVEGSLVPFTYAELQRATKNFSDKLGEGGFGSVFKGILPDSTAVAVKKLEGLTQGEKQFRTEVSTLGTIQHVNLVRLRGFCSEGTKRLLVYDYMPNGSLDSCLFPNKSKILDWRTRYQIIQGIARGLAYLHEKCREKIIHCDIKPENILLDAEYCPKVADFGMAKLVGRDFSRVLTTMRGTVGYLAPEWISGLAITPKADVYSFGMMLLEVISGKRNTEKSNDGTLVFFPVWAASKVYKGEILSLLDHKLEGNAEMEELRRACRVACWCIQDSEAHRPSMGLVVQILDGVLEVNVPPIPRSLQLLITDKHTLLSSMTPPPFNSL